MARSEDGQTALSAERSDTPLVEMDRSDVDALLFEYKHDYEMAEGTLRNYRKALKKFGTRAGENTTRGARAVGVRLTARSVLARYARP
jgi:hypothetical protein